MHGITETDSLALANKPAWHGLGEVFERENGMKADEVNDLAGLNWEVEKVPGFGKGRRLAKQQIARSMEAYLADRTEERLAAVERALGFKIANRSYYTSRMDTGDLFREVGERYTIMQNADAPVFLDNLVDSKEAYYETAGSLWGGKWTFWLMRLPEDILIGGDKREAIGQYIGLRNTHDGSGAINLAVTPVRWVCNNTLTYGLRSAKHTYDLRHTPLLTKRYELARTALDLTLTYTDHLKQLGDELANTPMNDEQFLAFLDEWMPLPEVEDKATSLKYLNAVANRSTVINLYFEAENLEHVRNTRWAALMAVSEFLDHHVKGREGATSTAQESRFVRNITGHKLNQRALELLTK